MQYLGELGAAVEVRRNDQATIDDVGLSRPEIVISPGPCTPNEAGITLNCSSGCREGSVLGVCLGHRAIGQAFGGKVARNRSCSKVSRIRPRSGVFPAYRTTSSRRYHSLVIERSSPDCLALTAQSRTEIMGVRHRSLAVEACSFTRRRC